MAKTIAIVEDEPAIRENYADPFRRQGFHVDPYDERASASVALQPEQMRVSWRGKPVQLTVTELWISHALAHHPGLVKSRQRLMEAADAYVDLATITSHIKRIRGKFLEVDPAFDAIEAVYGAGYRWLIRD